MCFLLFLWECHINAVFSIYPPLLPLILHESILTLHSLSTLSLFKNTRWSSLCCLYTHGCRTIHQGLVNIVEATSLKKMNFFSSRSHQPPTATHLGVGIRDSFLSMLECWLAGSCAALVQATIAAMRLWVHWSRHIQKSLFPSSPLQSLALTILLFLLPKWSWALGVWVWFRCPTYGWTLHRFLFSTLILVVSFCINCCLVHKETSPMRCESCTNLGV